MQYLRSMLLCMRTSVNPTKHGDWQHRQTKRVLKVDPVCTTSSPHPFVTEDVIGAQTFPLYHLCMDGKTTNPVVGVIIMLCDPLLL